MAWTVVGVLSVALIAMLGLLATALFQLRQDISRLGTELRGEFRSEIGSLRTEFGVLRGEFGALRGEFGALRGEFGVLRREFTELRAEVRADIRHLEERLRTAGA